MAHNFTAHYPAKLGPRARYLREEHERVQLAASLAETFPHLKSLKATLAYFGPLSATPQSEVKCTFNLAHAKSLFRFSCTNAECVGGNFDLSAELARAVTEHRLAAAGEVRCQGWQSKATVDRTYCGHILRYTISLGF